MIAPPIGNSWNSFLKALVFTLLASLTWQARGVEPGTPDIRWTVQQTAAVKGCAISSDATKIATGTAAGALLLLDSATGSTLRSIDAHAAAVNQVAFSPDNTLVASTSDD